jgi:predicted O-methyltransferase YrrM
VYTKDWFTNNIPRWEAIVRPYFAQTARSSRPRLFVELGTFEGRSARWLLENVLTRPGDRLVVVDWFKDAGTYERFMHNVGRPFEDRVTVLRGEVATVLRSAEVQRGLRGAVDFMYIDAIGDARGTLEAAVLAWPLLRTHGMIVFDDYTHDRAHGPACPRPGIDAFLDAYAHELKMLHASWQAMLIKRAKKLPVAGCFSEFYHEDVAHV